jgi:hypothetical protein
MQNGFVPHSLDESPAPTSIEQVGDNPVVLSSIPFQLQEGQISQVAVWCEQIGSCTNAYHTVFRPR